MDNLLISGVNTRAMVNSALKLDYNLFSTSYYRTYDFKNIPNEKHILKQSENKTCNTLEDNYSSDKLLKLSEDYLENIDYIILVSGLNPSDFNGKFKKYKKKILGNKNIEKIENKFDFYNKIKNKYCIPETFKINDIDEANEIIKNNEKKQYIIKPLKGFGGYGVNFLNTESINQLNDMKNQWIIQEYVEGENISSSVLSTKKDSKTIINSRNLNENDYKNDESFIYSGNLLPLNKEILKKNNSSNILKEMDEISEDLIKDFNLIGSNGVDYILDNEDNLHIIEVNPRFQGTYESCESLLNINLLEAHIKACQNELIEINNKIKGYSLKKIIYAENKVKIKNLESLKNVYDIPYPNVIIEKNQPIATIIQENKSINKLNENLKISFNEFKKHLLKIV
ncbi:ATP-grasp domain-containing protein [Methanobrevibacter sp. DSM 116169]|uniref:ATP-grasp domain-containing protein n=1 Tax=Methanobrevibacter sp. DSM 116169 TaxID=3242727 RepID=UPI0038FC430D